MIHAEGKRFASPQQLFKLGEPIFSVLQGVQISTCPFVSRWKKEIFESSLMSKLVNLESKHFTSRCDSYNAFQKPLFQNPNNPVA